MSEVRRSPAAPRPYDAFWHLQAIGLLPPAPAVPPPPAHERGDSEVWAKLSQASAALVAIIDTGVSLHPYLTGRIHDPYPGAQNSGSAVAAGNLIAAEKNYTIDLTALPSLVADKDAESQKPEGEMTDDWLSDWGVFATNGAKPWQKAVQILVSKNRGKMAFNEGAPSASNQKFSAHGTSCAGLIAASSKNFASSTVTGQNSAWVPPYYRGVDPFSKVMSITTSFAPRPDLLTLAFLLAANKGADVILFPRGLPREVSSSTLELTADEAALLGKGEVPEKLKWAALRETIIAVSQKIPIVCAVGNESENALIAPASFASDSNGIIAVAAMNYYGCRSSYSNFGKGITVAAPSDDAEIFNLDQARLDETDRFFVDHPYQYYVNKKLVKSKVTFAAATVRSIDVPGPFGFSDSSSNAEAGLATEPESFFTDFGGTSAAASIVAGVAALMQRAAKLTLGGGRKTGPEIRGLLQHTAREDNFPHLQNVSGQPDRSEEDWVDEMRLDLPLSFGFGLVAADKAVDAILSEARPVPVG